MTIYPFKTRDAELSHRLDEFIKGEVNEICVLMHEFDYCMEVLDSKNIETYSYMDAGDAIIERV